MRFTDVQLELVRPGPPHNQLLSPLTQYLALCGESSPVTLNLEFEHHRLLSRLERLRYVSPSSSGRATAVSPAMRERELVELGEDMGRFFGSIPSLAAEISNARVDEPVDCDEQAAGVHLRIVVSGSELSLLPYEIAVAPQAMPGEGVPTVLQGRVPIVATREVRRSRPLASRLDDIDHVKVLYVYAAPGGLTVPHAEHLAQLVAALGPWIQDPDPAARARGDEPDAKRTAAEIKKHIRVLPNATLTDIYEACARERFTHVHILAHGKGYHEAGVERYGIALCSERGASTDDVVNGQRLAHALGAESDDGNARTAPFWVTLAICDGGNLGSVLVPGGSIAHDLHSHGVPWVLASQFPLTKAGSVKLTRFMYPRLFRGDDPRQVLYEVRRYLFGRSSEDHDWASLVTYASTPTDFADQVATFLQVVSKQAIDGRLKAADEIASAGLDRDVADRAIEEALTPVPNLLDRWERRLPTGSSMQDRINRTNFFGLGGTTNKRMAILRARSASQEGATEIGHLHEARNLLMKALLSYERGKDEWATDGGYLWTASQYLVLKGLIQGKVDQTVERMCRFLVARDFERADTNQKGWDYATLAEIELLTLIRIRDDDENKEDKITRIVGKVVHNCEELVRLMGRNSFHVDSTLRQFGRYREGYEPLAAPGVLDRLRPGVLAALAVLESDD